MSSLDHTDCVGRNLHQMIIMYIECTSLKEQLSSKTAVAFRLDGKGHRGLFHSGLERQLFLRLDNAGQPYQTSKCRNVQALFYANFGASMLGGNKGKFASKGLSK